MTPSRTTRRQRPEVTEALAVARTLREELGLADEQPVDCILDVAERRLDLDVVLMPLRDELSGLYFPVRPHPLVLVSAKHPVSRQRFTLAHEVAHHALGHGASPRILESAPRSESQEAFDQRATATRPDAAVQQAAASVPDAAVDHAAAPEPDAAVDHAATDAATAITATPVDHYKPQYSTDPKERAANTFAGELLVPEAGAAALAPRWIGEPHLDQVVRLSAHYGVSALAALVKFQLLDTWESGAVGVVRDQLRAGDHLPRYVELGLSPLDDQLERHHVAGGGARCSRRARASLLRLRAEADAAAAL